MASETARLLASLDLKDGLTPVVKTMSGSLDRLDTRIGKSSSKAHKAGQQIGTGIKTGIAIGVGALTALGGLLLVSAKEGQEAAKVQLLHANAIEKSGKVSEVYVKRLAAQQDALLDLSGADDEVIKAAQTQLILMGLTGAQVEKLTPLALDLATATGKDLTTATLAVGKAAQGSNTALQRMGIILPKDADAVKELERRFGGATRALSGGLDVRLKVLNERLANVREEAGIKLLPAMTKIVDVVGRRLVPAFGEFVNAILPTAIAGLDKLAGFLERGGATSTIDSFLKTARDLMPAIQAGAEVTGRVITTAVDVFKSLPPEIQALAVAGLAINKLTGGLVTNIAGGLISAVISSFRGLMNVNAAVVNVNGPVTGVPGVPGAPGTKPGKPSDIPGVVTPKIGAGIAIEGATLAAGSAKFWEAAAREAERQGLPDIAAKDRSRAEAFRTDGLSALLKDVDSTSAAGFHKLLTATERAKLSATTASRAIAAAIRSQDLTPNVSLSVRNQTIINGRTFAANLTRYHTYVSGQGITRTSGFIE